MQKDMLAHGRGGAFQACNFVKECSVVLAAATSK